MRHISTIRQFIFLSAIILSGCQDPVQTSENSENGPEQLLLKDFRPQSIFNIPETEVEKAKYPVIDMHAHSYVTSAEKAGDWVNLMDQLGIAKSIILSYKTGKEFDSVVDIYSQYPDRFEVWCGFDYSRYEESDFAERAIAELVRCYEKGATGVGELGDKGKGLFYCKPAAPGMHSDDPRMDPLFEKCAELGLPVNIHMADPKWMYEKMDATNDGLMNAYKWRLDDQPDIVDHQGLMDILERTVQKHPNTSFIACHLANCSHDLTIVEGLLDKYPNLIIDIGARFAEITATPRNTKEFFTAYQDRIVYGTDMGIDPDMYRLTFRLLETADEHIYHSNLSYHWSSHALDLPDEILEKVYGKNALAVLHQGE